MRIGRHTDSGNSRPVNRRQILATAVHAGCVAAIGGLSLVAMARGARSLPVTALRPPGAGAEAEFLGACVRCGLCARDCPYDTLKLAGWAEEVATGTPYFEARKVPCEMCEDIPCVAACPTGALDKNLTNIDDARIGVAALIGRESCLNVLGLRCDVCYRVCPLIGEAITLVPLVNQRTGRHALFIPTVNGETCTGCGKCEKSCVLEESAIKVLPRRIAMGKIGDHYRLGWEEKRRRGEPLVKGIIDFPDRGYDGNPRRRQPTPGGGFKGFKP